MLVGQSATAETHCHANIVNIWAGQGHIRVYLTNGSDFILSPTDATHIAVMSMAMTALSASRQVTVRFAASGVDCTIGGRTDFVGMYLL